MTFTADNLESLEKLDKERGQVDLILTNPPYNTGQYFRYNDRWDNDPQRSRVRASCKVGRWFPYIYGRICTVP